MSERLHSLEEALLFMRDPLSRIELAASQLARAQRGAVEEERLAAIRRAVEDLDRRLQEALGALRAPRSRAGASDDCGRALRELVAELAPVFAARSRRLEPPQLAPGGSLGDAAVARRAALRLLRGAGGWAGAGGWLCLSLRSDPGRWGVGIRVRRAAHGAAGPAPAFREARRLAHSLGAEFEQSSPASAEAELRATLWFPRSECPA